MKPIKHIIDNKTIDSIRIYFLNINDHKLTFARAMYIVIIEKKVQSK